MLPELICLWVRILPIALTAGLGVVPSLASIQPVVAQTRIPKLPGYNDCPLGYVNDLKQHCVSPINYEVQPTNGQPCPSGWMNIGAGYCKKKTLGIF
jgi:hypothetical protein